MYQIDKWHFNLIYSNSQEIELTNDDDNDILLTIIADQYNIILMVFGLYMVRL